MAAKLAEGDTITRQGEVTMVHDDGSVTVRLHGYGVPITTPSLPMLIVDPTISKSPFNDLDTMVGDLGCSLIV